ncbi:MAG: hypothetical protein ACYTAF_03325 [Planctomycetota bacterium]|jgi:hypothetical protein
MRKTIALSLALLLACGTLLAQDGKPKKEKFVPDTNAPKAGEIERAAPEVKQEAEEAVADPDEGLRSLRKTSDIVGVIYIGVALVLMLFGWHIFRALWALMFAFGFGFAGYTVAGEYINPLPALGVGAAGALLGGAAGVVLQKAYTAIAGALLCGAIFTIPGALLGMDLLMIVLFVCGAVTGLIVGWKATHYLAALNASVLGGTLAAAAVGVLMDNMDLSLLRLVMLGTVAVVTALGCFIQFQDIKKQEKSGKIPPPHKPPEKTA